MVGKHMIPKAALFLAILGVIGLWVWGGVMHTPDIPSPIVEETTVFRHETVYACGHRDVEQGQAPPELQGLTISEILDLYPDSDGWSVFLNLPEEMVVSQKTSRLCAEHASYRHLGVYDGCVAVFEGPLGGGGRLLQVKDIPVDRLPEFYRLKLIQAAAFAEQSCELQDELRREMEFPDEEALHAALENLDEIQQD